MKKLCSCFLLLFFVDLSTQSSLQLVQVFFRHGSRTPEEKDTFPTNPYTEKDFLPMGWGQLTNIGKQRAFKLGQLLRQRYDTFLGDIYTPNIVSTQSTDFERTKMSALLALAGLFPPNSVQTWNDHLAWMPIPFSYEKAENDFFLRRPTNYCPTYVRQLKEVMENNAEIEKLLFENKGVMEYISKNTLKPMETLKDVFRIYQTFNAEDELNMTLPNWATDVYPQKIHELAGYQCFYENYNDVMKRLNGGRSLSKALENIEEKLRGHKRGATKIYLYSGHENNVVNILSALNLFEPHVPKYSAAAIIELHNFKTKERDDYKIRILYIRDHENEPEVKIIENCEAYCPYQQFLDITRSIIPTNYTNDCDSDILLD